MSILSQNQCKYWLDYVDNKRPMNENQQLVSAKYSKSSQFVEKHLKLGVYLSIK